MAILALLLPDFNNFSQHFLCCTLATAVVELCSACGEVPWNIVASQPPCSRFIMSNDPHSKCVKCMGFSHARETVSAFQNANFAKKLCLKFLRSRLEVFERESSVFPCHAPEASADFHVMWSSRQWRTSRRASPFLSLCYLMHVHKFSG